MIDKFFEKIVDEWYGKWPGALAFFALSVFIFVKGITFVLDKVTINWLCYLLIIIFVICLIVLNSYFIKKTVDNSYIRRASKDKTGILVNVDAVDRKIYDDTIRKFGEEFQRFLHEGFEVVYVPYGRNKIAYKDEKIVKLLQRKRCVLFLYVWVNTDKDGDNILYDIKVNSTIIHTVYADETEKKFQKVFTASLQKFCNIVFPSKEMIKRLQFTASGMSLACEYVIGLSFFLNGDFSRADDILTKLAKKKDKFVTSQEKNIYNSIQKIRNEIYITFSNICIEKFQLQYCDMEALNNLNKYLEKANQCCGKSYEYCLDKAYYEIAKNKDVKTASVYINICKQMKGVPPTWKYSQAFLKAYENKSINTICNSYKDALKVNYNRLDIIVFIETILQQQPERTGLFLALGILYQSIESYESYAKDNFNKYINNVSDSDNARQILEKKGYLIA